MRRWAGVTLASAAALALAAAAMRGHHEHHLVRKEDLQLPPAVDAKPLRDDLWTVLRCDFATGWPAASATSAAFALPSAAALALPSAAFARRYPAAAIACSSTAAAVAATAAAVPGHQAEHMVREEDAEVRPALVPKQLRADLRPVCRRAAAIVTAGVAATAAAAVRRYQEHYLV